MKHEIFERQVKGTPWDDEPTAPEPLKRTPVAFIRWVKKLFND